MHITKDKESRGPENKNARNIWFDLCLKGQGHPHWQATLIVYKDTR